MGNKRQGVWKGNLITMEMNFETMASVMENMITGICVFELKDGKISPVYLNEGVGRMLGYSMQETKQAFKNVRNSIIKEDIPVLEQAIIDVLRDDGAVDFELRTVTLSGGMRWVQVRANLYARNEDAHLVTAVIIDATERKNIEEELKQQAERFHLVAAAEGEMIFDYNAKTDVMMIRSAADSLNRNEIILNNYFEHFDYSNIHEEDVPLFFEVFRGALKSPKHDTVELRNSRFDEELKWYQCSLTSMAGVEGYVTRIIGRLVNIHERKLKEMDLKVKAEKDALTGMYNKGATEQLIAQCIQEDKDKEGVLHGLMMVDLDNFKEVNDILGHARGDKVLSTAAEKIINNFKGSDIIGRIGGDEFVVLMRDIDTVANTDVLATRLCEDMKMVLQAPEGEIVVSASIGIAIFPYHGKTYAELFEKADKALYTAKANGKDGYRVYDAGATLVYHANRNRKNFTPVLLEPKSTGRQIEDAVMQILFEDKVKTPALRSVLEIIAIQYGMNRAFICPAKETELTEEKEICFAAEGFEIGKETIEKKEERRKFAKNLNNIYTGFAIIHQYDEMEDEEREFMLKDDIRCMMYYPFYKDGTYQGAIFLEDHMEDELLLSEEQKTELKCLLRIVNTYVFQNSFISRVPNAVAQIQMMDNMDTYAYAIDADTYQISFVNRKVVQTMPHLHIIGEYCYKIMGNRDKPCEECLMRKLDRKNPHARESGESFNYSVRSWMKNSVCWLECDENSATCMMNCVDISDYLG